MERRLRLDHEWNQEVMLLDVCEVDDDNNYDRGTAGVIGRSYQSTSSVGVAQQRSCRHDWNRPPLALPGEMELWEAAHCPLPRKRSRWK